MQKMHRTQKRPKKRLRYLAFLMVCTLLLSNFTNYDLFIRAWAQEQTEAEMQESDIEEAEILNEEPQITETAAVSEDVWTTEETEIEISEAESETQAFSAEVEAFLYAVDALNKEVIAEAVNAWRQDVDNEALAEAVDGYAEAIAEAIELYAQISDSDQMHDDVAAAYTKLSELYQALDAAFHQTAVYDASEYQFTVDFVQEEDVLANAQIEFLNDIILIVTRQDGGTITAEEQEKYELRLKGVTSSDNTYTWNNTDTGVSTSATDGTTYTVTFGVWYKDGNDWVANLNGESCFFTKTYTVCASAEIKETLDSDDQYISNAYVKDYTTGTAPFDADDNAGNDSSADNMTIRTYDTISYTISVSSHSYTNGAYYKKGYVGFRFELPYSSDEAEFDTSTMGWLVNSTGTNYDYKITTETSNGVATQVLTGYRYLDADNLSVTNTFPVTNLEVNLAVKVKSMKNDATVQPKVYVWCDHNDVDFSNLNHLCANNTTHQNAANGGKELVEVEVANVTVTAAPRYNVQIKQVSTSYVSKMAVYDFSTGNDLALNKNAGDVYGRMTAYGITLQLYNNATNKGLKGIEIPTGDITFDLTFSASYQPDNGSAFSLDFDGKDSTYTPLVWSYEGNNNGKTQQDERVIYETDKYARVAAPLNTGGSLTDKVPTTGNAKCAQGGTWRARQNGTTVHFTVSGYAINPYWFPNVNQGATITGKTYFDPANGVESTYIGCFSAGEVFVVVPFGGDGTTEHEDYLAKKYGSGTIELTVQDGNLQATSLSGTSLKTVQDNSNQSNPNGAAAYAADDQVTGTVYLSRSGVYENYIHYTNNSTGGAVDFNGLKDNMQTGQDVGTLGQCGYITWGTQYNDYGENSNCMIGRNVLLKFDDKRLEITGTPAVLGSSATVSFLYGARSDKMGWRGDDEMDRAVEADLIYFTSLEALEAEGYTCVAVLAEWRYKEPVFEALKRVTGIPIKIKEDTELSGSVAQICISSTYWTWSTTTDPVPSRLDVQNGTAIMPTATGENVRAEYTKATYDAEGNYIGGHTGTYNIGDSLYILLYQPKINKFVLQKNADGTTKDSFNLDDQQNQVDFKLEMTLEQTAESSHVNTTTVIIEDTLPDGTTYNDDAVLGGTFALDHKNGSAYKGTVTGGAGVGATFTYTHDCVDYAILFESVTPGVDADGHNTLTFVFSNVPIGTADALPIIYYSVSIDTGSAVNGDQYVNKAYITSLEVQTDASATLGNYSEAGFSVAKNSSLSISKVAENMFVDNGEPSKFMLTWSNTGKNDVSGSPMMDTMPYNADENGSSFNGSYTLDLIQLINNNGSANDFSDLEVWYTTDTSLKDTYAANYTDDKIKNSGKWTKATVDSSTGMVRDIPTEGVVAWCILGTIKSGKMIAAECTVVPKDAKPGDHYVNAISYQNSEGVANVYIISRRISGLTWYDANQDGKRQSAEQVMSGVTVRLVSKADYEANGASAQAVTNLSGDVCEMKTGANGKYQFTNLPAGDFVVLFLEGDTLLSEYVMTETKKEGVNELQNSDATAVTDTEGKTTYGYIQDINMPESKDITSSPYEVKYLDAGFYRASGNLQVSKTVAGTMGDKTQAFDFQMQPTEPAYETIPETLSYVKTAADGTETEGSVSLEGTVYKFQLAHGETITFSELPSGTTYVITEPNAEAQGYEVKNSKVGGTEVESDEASGTLTEAGAQIAFTNTKNMAVPTRVGMNPMIAVAALVTATTGFLQIFFRKRKRESKKCLI